MGQAPLSEGRGHRHVIRAFGDVAAAMSQVQDSDALLHLIADKICDLVGVRRCSVYLRDERSSLFRGQVGHAHVDIDAGVKRLVAGVEADGFTREILATGAPVVVSDARIDPRPIRATMRSWGVRSMVGIPMVLDGDVTGLFFLDDEDRRHVFTPLELEIGSTFADLAAVAIAQAKANDQLRESMRTVARQNELLRRASAVDDRLGELALAGGNIREIVKVVAELTGKPAAIYDDSGQRRALGSPPHTNDVVVPRLLEAEFRDHPAVTDAVSAIEGGKYAIVGPIPEAGLNQRYLVAPVMVRERVWGHLVVMESGSRLEPLDVHVARRSAVCVALEISTEQRATLAEADARASLVADLVRGDRDARSLQRRADFVGIDLSLPHAICLIERGTDTDTAGIATSRLVGEAFERAACGRMALATSVAEGFLVILRLVDDASPRDAIRAAKGTVRVALAGLPFAQRPRAALSRSCSDVLDYAGAFLDARQVLRSIVELGPPGGPQVLSVDDLGVARLLLSAVDRTEADRFAHQALDGLLVGDATTADLLSTLRLFFDASRSIRKTAAMIGVHENTVRYRLARIEELTGLNVAADSADQMTAQFAILLLQLSGRCPWPAWVTEDDDLAAPVNLRAIAAAHA
jgi:sugar diacid utilization regulator